MLSPVYILDAKRTPVGAFQGQLSGMQGWQLGSEAIKSVVRNTHAPEEVIMGCVLGGGQGQAPVRQAVCSAMGTDSIPSTLVNKVCGSGMQSVALACNMLQLGQRNVMIAGGFESMTNSPYLLPKGRSGYRMGHGMVYDHMLLDGLEDAYQIRPDGSRRSMGEFADATAEKYGFSRADQEAFALQTFEKYQAAESAGLFACERSAITFTDAKGNVTTIEADEPPTRVKPAKFSALRPAFGKAGTVTAATSSGIADGGSALLLTSQAGLGDATPLARIVGYASYAHAPEWFTTAPVGAIRKLLDMLKWAVDEVDLFEVNEAFAVVPMAVMRDLGIDRAKMNVYGGACCTGHPIGSSSARILVTLVSALRARGLKRGVAAVCIGGGEAMAMAVEIC
jgi:acetyl-CoA C-acetyltransferase